MKKYHFGLRCCIVVLFGLAVSSSSLSQSPHSRQSPEPFVNVSQSAGIAAAHRGEWNQFDPAFTSGYLGIGQAWGDYDNDGWLDLYLTGNLNDSILYHNNGDSTFSVSPYSASVSLPGIKSGGTLWADYDNDGWLDLFIASDGPDVLFHNERGAGFVDVTEFAGVGDPGKGTSATWGDYNGDSYLDLYVTNWSCYPECGDPIAHDQARDTLYRNNRDGTFTDVSSLLVYKKLLGAGFAASFVDYDNDGDADIYVVNDMLKNAIGNVLWRNDGAGCDEWCWTDASAQAKANTRVYGMGLAAGDYDNDLDQDFYFTNFTEHMTLLQNQGDGTFVNAARQSRADIGFTSAVGWGTIFFDYDNDGWLDLYVTTTEFIHPPYREPGGLARPPVTLLDDYPDFLFRNNTDGTFTDSTPRSWRQEQHSTLGIAYADYDHDGWLDFVLGEFNQGYALYRNNLAAASDYHWLTVRLVGAGKVNRDAAGARVYLTTDDGQTRMREVISGSSLGAGSDLALHFGLADSGVAKLRIVWTDGRETTLTGIAADRILRITYPDHIQLLTTGGTHS